MDPVGHAELATADGHDRHVPSGSRDILSAGHEGVYEWAVEALVGEHARFLDLGCGTGYGSALVTAAGAEYDGVDGSSAAIDYARAHFSRPTVRFFVADLMGPLPDALVSRSYDVVFSSEVLEHVEDPFALVGAMASSLRDDGACFVGTPNRLWSRDHMPGGGLLARSHVMEFTPPALEALLRTAFDDVDLLYRMLPHEAIRSSVVPVDRSRMVRAARAFAREVAPSALTRHRMRAYGRHGGQEWTSGDIVWLPAGDPQLDPTRSVGLAAVCGAPRR